jgi:hypothetical protein
MANITNEINITGQITDSIVSVTDASPASNAGSRIRTSGFASTQSEVARAAEDAAWATVTRGKKAIPVIRKDLEDARSAYQKLKAERTLLKTAERNRKKFIFKKYDLGVQDVAGFKQAVTAFCPVRKHTTVIRGTRIIKQGLCWNHKSKVAGKIVETCTHSFRLSKGKIVVDIVMCKFHSDTSDKVKAAQAKLAYRQTMIVNKIAVKGIEQRIRNDFKELLAVKFALHDGLTKAIPTMPQSDIFLALHYFFMQGQYTLGDDAMAIASKTFPDFKDQPRVWWNISMLITYLFRNQGVSVMVDTRALADFCAVHPPKHGVYDMFYHWFTHPPSNRQSRYDIVNFAKFLEAGPQVTNLFYIENLQKLIDYSRRDYHYFLPCQYSASVSKADWEHHMVKALDSYEAFVLSNKLPITLRKRSRYAAMLDVQVGSPNYDAVVDAIRFWIEYRITTPSGPLNYNSFIDRIVVVTKTNRIKFNHARLDELFNNAKVLNECGGGGESYKPRSKPRPDRKKPAVQSTEKTAYVPKTPVAPVTTPVAATLVSKATHSKPQPIPITLADENKKSYTYNLPPDAEINVDGGGWCGWNVIEYLLRERLPGVFDGHKRQYIREFISAFATLGGIDYPLPPGFGSEVLDVEYYYSAENLVKTLAIFGFRATVYVPCINDDKICFKAIYTSGYDWAQVVHVFLRNQHFTIKNKKFNERIMDFAPAVVSPSSVFYAGHNLQMPARMLYFFDKAVEIAITYFAFSLNRRLELPLIHRQIHVLSCFSRTAVKSGTGGALLRVYHPSSIKDCEIATALGKYDMNTHSREEFEQDFFNIREMHGVPTIVPTLTSHHVKELKAYKKTTVKLFDLDTKSEVNTQLTDAQNSDSDQSFDPLSYWNTVIYKIDYKHESARELANSLIALAEPIDNEKPVFVTKQAFDEKLGSLESLNNAVESISKLTNSTAEALEAMRASHANSLATNAAAQANYDAFVTEYAKNAANIHERLKKVEVKNVEYSLTLTKTMELITLLNDKLVVLTKPKPVSWWGWFKSLFSTLWCGGDSSSWAQKVKMYSAKSVKFTYRQAIGLGNVAVLKVKSLGIKDRTVAGFHIVNSYSWLVYSTAGRVARQTAMRSVTLANSIASSSVVSACIQDAKLRLEHGVGLKVDTTIGLKTQLKDAKLSTSLTVGRTISQFALGLKWDNKISCEIANDLDFSAHTNEVKMEQHIAQVRTRTDPWRTWFQQGGLAGGMQGTTSILTLATLLVRSASFNLFHSLNFNSNGPLTVKYPRHLGTSPHTGTSRVHPLPFTLNSLTNPLDTSVSSKSVFITTPIQDTIALAGWVGPVRGPQPATLMNLNAAIAASNPTPVLSANGRNYATTLDAMLVEHVYFRNRKLGFLGKCADAGFKLYFKVTPVIDAAVLASSYLPITSFRFVPVLHFVSCLTNFLKLAYIVHHYERISEEMVMSFGIFNEAMPPETNMTFVSDTAAHSKRSAHCQYYAALTANIRQNASAVRVLEDQAKLHDALPHVIGNAIYAAAVWDRNYNIILEHIVSMKQ